MQISNQQKSSHSFHMKMELKIKSIYATVILSKLFALLFILLSNIKLERT